jgi:CRP-like cAMP-binding protein
MTQADLHLLRTAGSEIDVPAGLLLMERGQPAAGLFVILEGSVVVEKAGGTHELGPGSVVGERGLIAADGRRAARVQTASDVRVLAVGRSDFDRLAAADASLVERLTDAAS